ncbi:MAG: hypothetical protein Q8O92_00590 [Candidatus Latescibacter sp.]|nr:hypothetical protein [Candidatus Latescibacter sp.]
MVAECSKEKFRFTTLGIVLGIIVVVLSIVWVTVINLYQDDSGANDITWVG